MPMQMQSLLEDYFAEEEELNLPEPNPLQHAAITAYFTSLENGGARGTLVLPMGTGKTYLGLYIWDLLDRPRTLIVVPRKVLLHQWVRELQKTNACRSPGVFYGEEKDLRYVTVSLYQTLHRHPHILRLFEFVIFDEADFLAGDVYQPILMLVASGIPPYAIGLTGTYEEAARRQPLLRKALPPLYVSTIRQAQSLNLLSQVDVIPVYVNLLSRERIEYEDLYEAYKKQMSYAQSLPEHSPEKKEELRKAFMIKRKMLNILSNSPPKILKVVELLAKHKDEMTLVFSESVDSLYRIQDLLDEMGIPSEVIIAETPRKERERILDNFGKTFNVLLSVSVLERGYNVPALGCGIIMAGGKSLRQNSQRLGRLLRRDPRNPYKRAKLYIVMAKNTIDTDVYHSVRKALSQMRIL